MSTELYQELNSKVNNTLICTDLTAPRNYTPTNVTSSVYTAQAPTSLYKKSTTDTRQCHPNDSVNLNHLYNRVAVPVDRELQPHSVNDHHNMSIDTSVTGFNTETILNLGYDKRNKSKKKKCIRRGLLCLYKRLETPLFILLICSTMIIIIWFIMSLYINMYNDTLGAPPYYFNPISGFDGGVRGSHSERRSNPDIQHTQPNSAALDPESANHSPKIADTDPHRESNTYQFDKVNLYNQLETDLYKQIIYAIGEPLNGYLWQVSLNITDLLELYKSINIDQLGGFGGNSNLNFGDFIIHNEDIICWKKTKDSVTDQTWLTSYMELIPIITHHLTTNLDLQLLLERKIILKDCDPRTNPNCVRAKQPSTFDGIPKLTQGGAIEQTPQTIAIHQSLTKLILYLIQKMFTTATNYRCCCHFDGVNMKPSCSYPRVGVKTTDHLWQTQESDWYTVPKHGDGGFDCGLVVQSNDMTPDTADNSHSHFLPNQLLLKMNAKTDWLDKLNWVDGNTPLMCNLQLILDNFEE